jgi:predicted P-loop ATPase
MVGVYNSVFSKKTETNLSILEYLDKIKSGFWQDIVLDVRTNKIKKDKAPAVTLSGTFGENKSNDSLIQHSGFICIDVDSKDQIAEVGKMVLSKDPYTYAIHDSISGNGGFIILVKIDPNKHLDAFLGLEKYYFENYKIVIDKSCKNVSRLRFVSYDPDLLINEKSKVFKSYLKKAEKKIENKPLVIKKDFDRIVNEASQMNLFDSYDDYIKCCFALVHEFKEDGRGYFHKLCERSFKYKFEDADKDYSKVLKSDKGGITIASLYRIFKQNGIELKSEETKEIEKIVKLSDNPNQALKEKGIELTDDFIKIINNTEKKEPTKIDEVIDLIKLEKIRFNEVTRTYEFKGVEMNDRILSEFYTKVWQKIDEDFSKDKIFTLIQNRNNTESYHPIQDWFYKNKNLVTSNEFEKLKKCFKIKHTFHSKEESGDVIGDEYLDVFLKKWLLGLVASAFGTYSLMILVLNGEQGTNKTKFFRNLLPYELRKFYSESNLDEGKDSEILMCKKWLIIDDEFGGKNKKDATKLKRLSSQQTFSIRMPYGRVSEDLLRLAVLGGTSNDMEVINDPTGNRRVIPINLVSFDFEAYDKINKDKLFIELFKEWENDKDGWFLTKKEVEVLNYTTKENQEVWAEEEWVCENIVADNFGSLSTTEILLEMSNKNHAIRTNTKRIGMVMKKLGYETKIKKINGYKKRYYECSFNFKVGTDYQ